MLDSDPIATFYDRHPYPPPVSDPVRFAAQAPDARSAPVAHHLIWPDRPFGSLRSVLVAGCGTSQAVRHALRHPGAHVVGIDVSAASLDHARALATAHGVTNLELRQLPL